MAGARPHRWQKEMKIRIATRDDAEAVRQVHLSAFPHGEGDIISQLAVNLLSEEASPPVFSLLAEADDIGIPSGVTP
jgi:predicted N-acetyltransferase YhbS